MARRVLVVEDDPDLRTMMEHLLAGEGYAPVVADNGKAALELLTATAVDIILLDLMMPVMDGWSFRVAQLARPDIEAIPVIVMSALEPQRSADLGACRVFRKPIDFDALLGAIADTVAR